MAKLGALAERYFADDATGSLVKLRQFSEFIAKDIAAKQGMLSDTDINFDGIRAFVSGSPTAQGAILSGEAE